MNNKGTVKIRGVDPGDNLVGVSEWTFEYEYDTGFVGKAFIDDFFTLKVPGGPKMNHDKKLLWLFEWFTNAAKRPVTGDLLCIEDVPNVRNPKVAASLHEASAAIIIPHVKAGYEIMRFATPSWKMEAMGKGSGNFKKEEVMVWALGGNLPIDSENLEEDAVDALCIGLAGMKRVSSRIGFEMKNFHERVKIMSS